MKYSTLSASRIKSEIKVFLGALRVCLSRHFTPFFPLLSLLLLNSNIYIPSHAVQTDYDTTLPSHIFANQVKKCVGEKLKQLITENYLATKKHQLIIGSMS